MKKYIATFRGAFDLVLYAKSWKDAAKDARSQQKEYGKLLSVRRMYN